MTTFFDDLSKKGLRQETIEACYKINTHAGLPKYVAGMIPCSCLKDLKKEAMTALKMSCCWFCKKIDIKEKLFH